MNVEQKDTVPQLLLRPRDAAAALAISERLLWSLTAAGEVPCVRIGRTVRYSTSDLQAWIDRRRVEAGQFAGDA